MSGPAGGHGPAMPEPEPEREPGPDPERRAPRCTLLPVVNVWSELFSDPGTTDPYAGLPRHAGVTSDEDFDRPWRRPSGA